MPPHLERPPEPAEPAESAESAEPTAPTGPAESTVLAEPTEPAGPVETPGPAASALVALDRPADGIPEVVVTAPALTRAAEAIAAGDGPVALDAERASGYRYGQRAYLVQLRREGAGTWLVDPVACPDLTALNRAISGAEWVLHAATQDLPCLAEVGLRPRQLFDTELAGRLLGLPRVGLGAVVEHYLGLSLAKEHSAVDWSTRPLPEPWLLYAALDVEVLVEVRNLMGADLAAQGKSEWARQEFEALLSFAPVPRTDPWRRTSGMHKIRQRRVVAVLRELWEERERIALQRDTAPGRILPDAALLDLAEVGPRSPDELPRGHRGVKRYQRQWLSAIRRGNTLGERQLPPLTVRSDGPPPQRSWAERDPLAAARLTRTRQLLTQFASEHAVPVENVCSPEPLRRVVWTPPAQPTAEAFDASLAAQGCRPWQREIVVPMLAQAFAEHPDA